MSSPHAHKGCGGGVFTAQYTPEVFCDKCHIHWPLTFFSEAPYDTWQEHFIGYHPQQESFQEQEIFVNISDGAKSFTALRKRKALRADRTLVGESGKWSPASF